MTRWNRWLILRGALFAAALGLLAYIAFRYTLYLPPDHGTAYGKIFPFSAVIAAAGMALAVQPFLFQRLSGVTGAAARFGLTGLGGIWMATGLLCARTLARGAIAAPLGGGFDLLHMVSDHIFLPLAIAMLVWIPETVAHRLGGTVAEPVLRDAHLGTTQR